ncbi:YHS domain-containing protein [Brevibacillus sp. SYP-B805]|uniref:XdhC family protein n=1 Tax=Brevibacillus sp. SYP-B805 TaxID=1578199 RepID=UPI0013EB1E44|nr:XdhC family protein [Brevibacillus sp. SYP-B805]NGQ95816.1 YHS domain-containing protein [Brevibacillus sp. SYP-B805]
MEEAREPFAVVTVVRTVKPTSAIVGAKALITSTGEMIGFVGGQCIQTLVVSQALKCIENGASHLVLITSDPSQSRTTDGLTVLPMTCHSEGTVELFIEPKLPAPVLLVIGHSPIADNLQKLAAHLNFQVRSVVMEQAASADASNLSGLTETIQAQLSPGAYVVVASMGLYDTESILALQGCELSYVGLVTSPKRREAVLADLKIRGVSEEFCSFLSAPAGLDLGAVDPAEIAVTILAEIIEYRRKKRTFAPLTLQVTENKTRREVIDPICHMVVDLNTTLHKAEYQGKEYGFCCPHCRQEFLKNPEKYAHTVEV